MKIFICSSKWFYDKIPPISSELEKQGHEITFPNCYDDPFLEERIKEMRLSDEKYSKFKSDLFKEQNEKIRNNDAILVLNFEKNGIENYIGGATFLEMYEAWKNSKKIYLYNPIPNGMLADEIKGFSPILINQDLSLLTEF